MPDDKVITLDNISRFLEDLENKNIKDITEQDIADQSVLAEIYNNCPQVLRVSTNTQGIQRYKLDNDDKSPNNKVYYSCLLFGALVELSIIKSNGTYTIDVQRYDLTPIHN